MPSTVRLWMPQRIALATAVYANGLLMGEILPVSLTMPFVLPVVGDWRGVFLFWSVPVAAMVVLLPPMRPAGADAPPPQEAPRRWWPDWNDALIWKLGLILGSVNALYFGVNAFIPDYLTATGRGEWINAALTALNVGQILALGAAAVRGRAARRQGVVLRARRARRRRRPGGAGLCERHLADAGASLDRIHLRLRADPRARATAADRETGQERLIADQLAT